jgi:hypothetical protein
MLATSTIFSSIRILLAAAVEDTVSFFVLDIFLGRADAVTVFWGTGAYLAGFGIGAGGATVLRHGTFTISTLGSNIWAASGNIGISGLGAYMAVSAGTVTLSGTLDRVRITTVNGTDTFDAGSINLLLEG